MRFVALAIGTIAAFTLVLGGIPGSPSQATSPPSAQRFSIDMEPALLPANTATSVGTTETRASINENNVLDADEDAVDTVYFDVTVRGIPPENPMTAYGYTLSYPSGAARIVLQQPMLIGPPDIIISSDPLPDADGSFHVAVSDPLGPAESGDGVLDRLGIESTAVAPHSYILALSSAYHTDTSGQSHVPDAIDYGMICMNTSCGNPVDIEMVTMSLTSANPVPNDISTTVTVDESIRNNSGYTVNTDAQTTFTVPSDCTLNGATGTVVLNAALGMVAGLTTIAHQESPSLRCTGGGPHQMPVRGCGVVDDSNHADWNSANNCIVQTLSFNVIPPDSDGDGYNDEAEASTPLCGNGVNDDDVIFGGSDDGVVDDGCPGGPPQTGTYSEAQFNIGTAHQAPCGLDGWPSDFVSGGIFNSTDQVDIADLNSFLSPRRLDTSPGHPNFSARWDLQPGAGIFGPGWINVADLSALLGGASGNPPMFGGAKAFDGPLCPWPG